MPGVKHNCGPVSCKQLCTEVMNCAVLDSAYEVKEDQRGMDEVIVSNGKNLCFLLQRMRLLPLKPVKSPRLMASRSRVLTPGVKLNGL